MISGYEKGSDLSLLNVVYQYPRKNEETGKYSKDFIDIVYKDNITGKKNHETIYEPDYEFYKINDDIIVDHNLFFIEKENAQKVITPYNKLEKTIAEITNNEDFYYNCIQAGNRGGLKELHTIPNIMSSDMHIEDHYRYRFSKLYTNEVIQLNKAYFDIEVDTKYMEEDFPKLGECPVNAISYIEERLNKVYVYLLRDKNNPLINEFESNINGDLFKELKDFIIDNVGGPEKAAKFGVDNLEIEFRFFNKEINLIYDFFKTVNQNIPDFLLAWNMAFDIPYLIERIIALGYNPTDIICHPDFKEKYAYYFIDEMHKNSYEARGDKYVIASYTVFLDQLIHFASRRKGQAAFPNFKLDTAGEIITGVRKLDYSHITHNISELPYLEYKIFVFYNIMDTIVQKCIEKKVGDIDYIYGKCTLNNTRYEKGHRQTIYLTNRGAKEFYNDGFIIGNNINKKNKKENFPGALVGDPTHNSDYCKLKQNNQIYNIANNLDDFDYKSLYPSIDRENNMAPNTQIGKVYIPDKVHNRENPFNFEFYERGGSFLEDITSGNYIEACSRWFGLASYREWLEDLVYYFTNMKFTMSNIQNPVNGMFLPVQYFGEDVEGLINPVYYDDNLIKPVQYFAPEINMKDYLYKLG